jgi:hypothetical protein
MPLVQDTGVNVDTRLQRQESRLQRLDSRGHSPMSNMRLSTLSPSPRRERSKSPILPDVTTPPSGARHTGFSLLPGLVSGQPLLKEHGAL